MNKIFLFLVLLSAGSAFAEDAKNDWQNTTISDATIAKIQAAKLEYKTCASTELQKPEHQKEDVRVATDAIMKQCEMVLAKMRDVYLAEKVPAVIADRHLKQMRIQTTRSILQAMIFADAARKSGQ